MAYKIKYYWYLWSHNNAGGGRTYEMGVTILDHPFKIIADRLKDAPSSANVALMDWKEITKEEYKLYIDL